jgi:hypothetical protein
MFFSGLLFLIVLRHLQWLVVPEAILAAVGAALIAGAHTLNLKFSRQCQCCKRYERSSTPANRSSV